MKWRSRQGWSTLLLVVLLGGYALWTHRQATLEGLHGEPQPVRPQGPARAVLLLFPDSAPPGPCTGLAEAAERLARKLLERGQWDAFLPPLLVGDGAGATLVRQGAASAPPGALVREAPAPGRSADCITGPLAALAGALQVLPAGATDVALGEAATTRFPQPAAPGKRALPLVELPVPGSHRLVILLSGDGGWRELDQGIAAELNRQGVSVLGWNSLRYFWKQKTPQQLADDLAWVLGHYCARWQADDVALVGYSFGADVLPFAYPRLPPAQRRSVRFVSLLGLAHGADFKVRVGGWFGWGKSREVPILPVLAGLRPVRVQCIYGKEEKDSLCRELRGQIAEVVERPGGHHFDRDPVTLARIILDGWRQAAAAQP
ncbi:AcvB/VirJ family lysyl-phosphatidylglycerol hydrolase [Stenotrophomonas sp. YIM B06876]|uniref:AcvB/VirJ family lysyl-phosphatidylglycerol hydrolase n=1 Tax=Stenotrophomonas sp. YIM B06876 TaxID=3060211 RepID=UPI00273990A9|nr:AcvB/VirJ family lysyl-phosphatidylglycerol hydrolase [Stenotrophomonas sp. YIM B06876]